MKIVKILIIALSLLAGCKSAERRNTEFKKDIQAFYPEKEVCFRVDKSMKVGNWGQLLLKKDTLPHEPKWKLNKDFASGENCNLVVLTDRLNDSIIVGAVYPYKSDIEQSISEYTRWFYDGKLYIKTTRGKKTKMDTIFVQHNPPIDNPWIKSEKMD